MPTFVWKRNNVVLNTGGRVTIESPKFVSITKSESVVQIDRIVSYDFGDYTCEMTNQFGRTSKIVTLTVKSKSLIVILSCSVDLLCCLIFTSLKKKCMYDLLCCNLH